jgi:hypothetical protein
MLKYVKLLIINELIIKFEMLKTYLVLHETDYIHIIFFLIKPGFWAADNWNST